MLKHRLTALVLLLTTAEMAQILKAAEPADTVGIETTVKHLLVDEHVISQRHQVVRVLGKVKKHGIVLRPTPGMDDGSFYGFYHTVHYNPQRNKFQIWYSWGNALNSDQPYRGTGYAESDDGVHWTKPLVSADGQSNNVLPASGNSVTIDPSVPWGAPDKFKAAYMHITRSSGAENATRLAYSPDGIRWTEYNDGKRVTHRAADTQNQIFWDPIREKYCLLTRTDFKGGGGGPHEFRTTRIMHHADNDLLNHPSAWKTVKDAIRVDAPDKQFYPGSATERRQFHHLCYWVYEGIYFGIMNVWDTPHQRIYAENDFQTRHEQDVSDFYIGTSRDGLNFDKTWVHARQPLVPRGPAGSWDKDIVLPGSNIVTHANRHWIYYHGGNERIFNITAERECYIGLAKLPLDRFVGFRAGAEPGTIVTRPFKLEGPQLKVNVDASRGSLAVEILDATGSPIAGFGRDEAKRNEGVDQLRLEPSWSGQPDLGSLQGRTVRLKFHLTNATIYAFQITSSQDSFEVIDLRDEVRKPSEGNLCVASLCYRPRNFENASNARQLEAMAREAARRGARLLVTPECALTGFSMAMISNMEDSPDKRRLVRKMQESAEPIDGPAVGRFCALARELKVWLVLGFLEAIEDRQYNTAALIGPDGKIIGKYHKVWWGASSRGKDRPVGWKKGEIPPQYTYGPEVYKLFDIGKTKVGLMICTERENPIISQKLAKAGAQLIICPSFGSTPNDRLMSKRSADNQVPTVLTNPYEAVMTDHQGTVLLNVLDEDAVCIQNVPLPPTVER